MTRSVAVIDSGVDPNHPHVQDRGGVVRSWAVGRDVGGAWVVSGVELADDTLGHGTAVAAAILDLAPGAHLESIRVFEAEQRTDFGRVLAALDHALELAPDVVNLSLGTTDQRWRVELEPRLARFAERGVALVSPAFWRDLPAYPGCLSGAHGVRVDATLGRHEAELRDAGGRRDWFASPYPRDLPGLPRGANLSGVSFACANVTGCLLRDPAG